MVANAISRLDQNPELNRHAADKDDSKVSKDIKWNNFITLINHYNTESSDEVNNNYTNDYINIFANNLHYDKIQPLAVSEIVDTQRVDPFWEKNV